MNLKIYLQWASISFSYEFSNAWQGKIEEKKEVQNFEYLEIEKSFK